MRILLYSWLRYFILGTKICTIDGLHGSLSNLETSAEDTEQQHESVLNEMKEAAGRGE